MAGQNIKCVNCDQRDQGPAKKFNPGVPDGMMLIDINLIHEMINDSATPDKYKSSLQGWIKDI